MSNSSLVTYIKLSPYCNKSRRDKIRKITIHHAAGKATLAGFGATFTGTREVSSNYGIDSAGQVGMYVEECNRAWTSSSPENDHQAITIEVSNDRGEPDWHVSDAALEATINLCVDICKRNGIEKLIFTGDKSGNLTMHKYFAATGCPGPYLESKFPYIAEEVNKRLGVSSNSGGTVKPPEPPPATTNINIGDIVQFNGGGVFKSSMAATPKIIKCASRCKVTNINDKGTHPYHLVSQDGKGVYGWTNASDIEGASMSATGGGTVDVKVGDVVQFNGGGVYVSANAEKSTTVCAASRCTVTAVHRGKHPYHLVSQDGKGVYGWVDSMNISK